MTLSDDFHPTHHHRHDETKEKVYEKITDAVYTANGEVVTIYRDWRLVVWAMTKGLFDETYAESVEIE